VSSLQKFLASTQGLQTALRVLQGNSSSMVNALEGVIHAPSETLGSMLATAQQTIQALNLPSVRAVCDTDSPVPVEQLLAERATIHLVAPGDQGQIGPIFVALLSDIFAVASRNTGRPPLEILLDEVANIAPIPSLPTMMSTGGGNGIVVLAVLQSLAQARGRWGDAGANALLDASTFKLILPGLTQPQDLEALAALAGYEDVERTSTTSHDQGKSTTTGWERRPRMTGSDIRELQKGTAYLLARNHPPLQIALVPYWERPYGNDVR
jgi:type IV secretion system protein VirD4